MEDSRGTTYQLRVKVNDKEIDEVLKKFYEATETIINLAYQMQTWPTLEIAAADGKDYDDSQKIKDS